MKWTQVNHAYQFRSEEQYMTKQYQYQYEHAIIQNIHYFDSISI